MLINNLPVLGLALLPAFHVTAHEVKELAASCLPTTACQPTSILYVTIVGEYGAMPTKSLPEGPFSGLAKDANDPQEKD